MEIKACRWNERKASEARQSDNQMKWTKMTRGKLRITSFPQSSYALTMLPPSHYWGQKNDNFVWDVFIYRITTSPKNCSESHFFRLTEKKSRQQIAWDPIKRKSSGAGGVINPTNRSSGQNWKLFLHNVRSGEKEEISKLPAHVGASNSKLDQTLDLSISTSNTLSSLSCLLWRRFEKIMPPVYSGIVQTRHCPKCQECHQTGFCASGKGKFFQVVLSLIWIIANI